MTNDNNESKGLINDIAPMVASIATVIVSAIGGWGEHWETWKAATVACIWIGVAIIAASTSKKRNN